MKGGNTMRNIVASTVVLAMVGVTASRYAGDDVLPELPPASSFLPEKGWEERWVKWVRNCSPSRSKLMEQADDPVAVPREEVEQVYEMPIARPEDAGRVRKRPNPVRHPVYW